MTPPPAAPACPACGAPAPEREWLRLDGVPALCNRLHADRDSARRAPRGDIRLVFCRECGHVFNRAFSPPLADYSSGYDNSLEHSPRFREYADALARRLVRLHHPRGRFILEIGCGRGEFLTRICRMGACSGCGMDPGLAEEIRMEEGGPEEIRLIPGVFSARRLPRPPDLFLCRHVLEHLDDPGSLLEEIARAAPPGTPIYIEVPAFDPGPDGSGFWDIIHEHPSYFTPDSLTRLLNDRGFRVDGRQKTFAGQYLSVDARIDPGTKPETGSRPPEGREEALTAWAASQLRRVEAWKNSLSEWKREGRRVVVWGTGSKGVTFLNLTKAGEAVDFTVDINPRKQSRFVPGTGTPVAGPARLSASPPDVILVVNPIYSDEIRTRVKFLTDRIPELVPI